MAVSILLVRTLVDAVEAAHIPRGDFLSRVGFDAERLEALDGRLELDEYDALIQHALDATSDPALGLRVLDNPAIAAAYNVTSHLVAHAKCLRESIDTLARYHRLISDRPYWEVEEDERTATIRYRGEAGPPRARRYRAEFTVTAMYKMAQYFVRNARPLRVAFEHAAPPYRDVYTQAFDGLARFEQPFTGIVIPRELMDETHANRDAEFHSTLQEHATKKLARLERATTYAERVSARIASDPSRRDMRAVARALGVSPRTLRRRLAEEGAQFNATVDRALASLATRLLVDERSTIQEIAHRLHFSDASTFCRAFKRWTGATPKHYLATHANEGDERAAISSARP